MKLINIISIMFLLLEISLPKTSVDAATYGTWELLYKSIGISAMHMQVLNNDRVIMFDRTNFGKSQINLTDSQPCRVNDMMVNPDCTAHSVEYDILTNTFRPLRILTDTWCSCGAVTPDGQLTQIGGWRDGERVVRQIESCTTTTSCDWNELGNKLNNPRWYSSVHILPDGTIIIVGGIGQYNYEFYPKTTTATQGARALPFLKQTTDSGGSYNNLYPFVFLSPDDNLFIFANNRSILLDYKTNTVLRTYPTILGGQPRCYPSTGSAVLLPLKNIDNDIVEAEVLVCGGAPKGSLQQANNGNFVTALNDCGRLRFTDANPQWTMETMPMPRVMGDMVILPNGDLTIINGCRRGVAGWELCREDIRTPLLYKTNAPPGSRFELCNGSPIPRVYHSTAALIRDGRILVGGSNTHFGYDFTSNPYPTELSLEAFSPWYMKSTRRPVIDDPTSLHISVKYDQQVSITFTVGGSVPVKLDAIKVTIVSPSFNTHSFSQGQRSLELTIIGKVIAISSTQYQVTAKMPKSDVLAPPIYYMMFVVSDGVPSVGIWCSINH